MKKLITLSMAVSMVLTSCGKLTELLNGNKKVADVDNLLDCPQVKEVKLNWNNIFHNSLNVFSGAVLVYCFCFFVYITLTANDEYDKEILRFTLNSVCPNGRRLYNVPSYLYPKGYDKFSLPFLKGTMLFMVFTSSFVLANNPIN
jgi:hypothetical protein